MPRKKKTETDVTETKKVTKRATKKEKANLMTSEFTIAEVAKWTDEECEAKEKEFQFKITDIRDILKSLLQVNKDLVTTKQNLNLLKTTLSKGLMRGYQVMCPHCKREYVVNSMELNREGAITCKICGTEYKENENIKGLEMETDESTSGVVKENETVIV